MKARSGKSRGKQMRAGRGGRGGQGGGEEGTDPGRRRARGLRSARRSRAREAEGGRAWARTRAGFKHSRRYAALALRCCLRCSCAACGSAHTLRKRLTTEAAGSGAHRLVGQREADPADSRGRLPHEGGLCPRREKQGTISHRRVQICSWRQGGMGRGRKGHRWGLEAAARGSRWFSQRSGAGRGARGSFGREGACVGWSLRCERIDAPPAGCMQVVAATDSSHASACSARRPRAPARLRGLARRDRRSACLRQGKRIMMCVAGLAPHKREGAEGACHAANADTETLRAVLTEALRRRSTCRGGR